MDIVRLSPYIITGSQSVIHKQDEDPFLQQYQVVGKCLQGLCFGHTDAPTQHGCVALIRGILVPRRGNAPPHLEIPVRVDSSPPMWSQYQSRYHTPPIPRGIVMQIYHSTLLRQSPIFSFNFQGTEQQNTMAVVPDCGHSYTQNAQLQANSLYLQKYSIQLCPLCIYTDL